MVIHFNNTQDRLDFIRGKHTEIKPKEVKKAEEKKPAKTSKKTAKKTAKKEK